MYPAIVSIDGRMRLDDIISSFAVLEQNGWQKKLVVTQLLERDGERFELPVYAWYNSEEADYALIGGIHGREPAGTNAIAGYAGKLLELGKKRKILVLPLCNPWGYLNHIRYGTAGQSVSDSDHLLGRAAEPACAEAAAITAFITETVSIQPGAAVLDLHEDPVYEAEGYILDRWGTYLYISGRDWQHTVAAGAVIDYLKNSELPLIIDGVTRFDETISDGIVPNTEDGSIDELLYKRGASPVITVENILHSEINPPLDVRVKTYLGVLDAFFGA